MCGAFLVSLGSHPIIFHGIQRGTAPTDLDTQTTHPRRCHRSAVWGRGSGRALDLAGCSAFSIALSRENRSGKAQASVQQVLEERARSSQCSVPLENHLFFIRRICRAWRPCYTCHLLVRGPRFSQPGTRKPFGKVGASLHVQPGPGRGRLAPTSRPLPFFSV